MHHHEVHLDWFLLPLVVAHGGVVFWYFGVPPTLTEQNWFFFAVKVCSDEEKRLSYRLLTLWVGMSCVRLVGIQVSIGVFWEHLQSGGARSFVVAKTYDLHITFRSISYFATPLIPSPCVITIYITGCLICESIWHCGRRRSQPTTPHTYPFRPLLPCVTAAPPKEWCLHYALPAVLSVPSRPSCTL